MIDRLELNGYKGYDPAALLYTGKSKHVYDVIRKIRFSFVRKTTLSLISRFAYYFPNIYISLSNPDKVVYTKGLSLVLSALVENKLYNNNKILAHSLADKILDRAIPSSGLWGHDISYWIGNKFISNQTPNIITTYFALSSLLDLAEHQSAYKQIVKTKIKSALNIFPFIKSENNNRGCFMYTPHTDYHVHNANLLFASLLARCVSLDLIEKKYSDIVESAINYSLTDFKESGLYRYAGNPTPNNSIDNYHTGYILRSLHAIINYLPPLVTSDIKDFENQLFNYYCNTFIRDYVYKYPKKSPSVIETHSLSESIIILSLYGHKLDYNARLEYIDAINRTANMLYKPRLGYFINNIKFICPHIAIKDYTEMPRWSTAWMINALSRDFTSIS
ncbi:hypothetical protein [Synechococcus sp. MIT S9509]|uniref:hypothetical protein n=1 Tax=Synechococcus sp. MIT S9509 TaxID=1801630 RepID=UPI0012E847B8|nr:hypothetical protein [Synechococcus sp. MIT S9509]